MLSLHFFSFSLHSVEFLLFLFPHDHPVQTRQKKYSESDVVFVITEKWGGQTEGGGVMQLNHNP